MKKKSLFSFIVLLLCIASGCGTTIETLSSDPKVVEEIKNGSENRIARIVLDDTKEEYGSNVTINPLRTEWKTARVEKRDYNEINILHLSDSWKFVEGFDMHAAVPTNTIHSITIPADRIGTGMLIGGLAGAALGGALIALLNSGTSTSFSNASGINTFLVLDILLFSVAGILLGAQIGAAHQTQYIR